MSTFKAFETIYVSGVEYAYSYIRKRLVIRRRIKKLNNIMQQIGSHASPSIYQG